MAAILSSRQTSFLPEVIPESWIYQKDDHYHYRHFELWSMLLLKDWRRYANLKIWPTLWPVDINNDVLNTQFYKCSHSFMIAMHRKLMVIFMLMPYLSGKLSLFNLKRNSECRLRGHPVASSSWKIPFCIIWDDFFISEVKLKLCLIFQSFPKWPPIYCTWQTFFTGSDTGSWIYQKNSHWLFRYFKLWSTF